MNGIYRLLVKTTLVAALILTAVSIVTAVTLETAALVPMMLLAVASAAYARWQMGRTSA